MRRFYAFAMCAGMACFLAVIYTLLHLDWSPPAESSAPKVEAGAPPEAGPGRGVEGKR